MVSSIWDDIKREYHHGNMVTRIIMANVAVYLAVNVLWLFMLIMGGADKSGESAYDKVLRFFETSSDWWHNLTHPWAFITNQFLHEGFFHIAFNMLFLYWFGRIVGDLIGNHRILPLYLLSGLVGNIVFVLSANFLPYGQGSTHYALGASGAIMGITLASAVLAPNYIMRLLLLGDIKLKYIVLVLLIFDFVGIASFKNTGGHFAHLGGALFGWLFVQQLRDGRDWSVPVNRLIDGVRNFFGDLLNRNARPQRPYTAYRNPNRHQQASSRRWQGGGHHQSDTTESGVMNRQERIDLILDKIKQSGYDSLTEEEKEFLFKASKE